MLRRLVTLIFFAPQRFRFVAATPRRITNDARKTTGALVVSRLRGKNFNEEIQPIAGQQLAEKPRRKRKKVVRPTERCIHLRDRTQCLQCQPHKAAGRIRKCEHGIRKAKCLTCGGRSLCQHGKMKSRCVSCCAMCTHNKPILLCVLCQPKIKVSKGPRRLCEHGQQLHGCFKCGGPKICQHNQFQYRCPACSFHFVCRHGLRRSLCWQCDGSGLCEHQNVVEKCIFCGGKQVCWHGKLSARCRECVKVHASDSQLGLNIKIPMI